VINATSGFILSAVVSQKKRLTSWQKWDPGRNGIARSVKNPSGLMSTDKIKNIEVKTDKIIF